MILSVLSTFQEILRPFPSTRRALVGSLALMIGASAVSLTSLVLLKGAMDTVLQTKGAPTASLWILLYLFLQVLGRFLGDFAFLVYGRFDQGTQRALGRYLFDRLQILPFEVCVEQSLGSLAHRIEKGFAGFRSIIHLLFTNILPMAFDTLFILGMLGVLYGWRWPIFGALFVVTSLWLNRLFWEKLDKRHERCMFHARRAFGRCFDTVVNYETIRYFDAQAHAAGAFHKDLARLEKGALSLVRILFCLGNGQNLLTLLFLVSLLAIMAQTQGTLHVTDWVLICLYLLQMTRPFSLLGSQIQTIRNALLDLQSLFGVLVQPGGIEEDDEGDDLTSLERIDFKNVSFAYGVQGRPLLKNLNLTLRRGEHVGIVGRSGAGKTTLTRLLFRLQEPTAGQILINGRDIRSYRLSALRKRLSIVPQEVVLLNETIAYNIRLANPEAPLEALQEAIRQAGLHALISSLPQTYNTAVGERGAKFSGGERQRLGLARALLRSPDLCIFDEATAALDMETEREIQKNLQTVCAPMMTLTIAHRLSAVRHCDRILVMEEGQIVEEGSHETLLARNGVYATLFKGQTPPPKTGTEG